MKKSPQAPELRRILSSFSVLAAERLLLVFRQQEPQPGERHSTPVTWYKRAWQCSNFPIPGRRQAAQKIFCLSAEFHLSSHFDDTEMTVDVMKTSYNTNRANIYNQPKEDRLQER